MIESQLSSPEPASERVGSMLHYLLLSNVSLNNTLNLFVLLHYRVGTNLISASLALLAIKSESF